MAFDSLANNDVQASFLKSKAKQEMIEIGGRLSQVLGVPRSVGQIYGLLYFSSKPLSLSDLSNMLGISKASTSTGTRQLATWGAIRKVWIPGERKDYYEAVEDLVQLFTGSYTAHIKPRMISAESRLVKIEESLKNDLKMQLISQEEHQFIVNRLIRMKKINKRLSKVIPIVEKLFL